jgi:hypothetical protein
MNNIWNAEKEVDIHLAQQLIEQQFPELIPFTIKYIGNPALDLTILYDFLPRSAWPFFMQEYGHIADNVLEAALFRAHCIVFYIVMMCKMNCF